MNAMLLETKDLCKYYGSGENLVKAIDHTTMTIQRGEFTAIVGRSGSGKSTLLHMLGALDRPDKGSVWIEGKNVFDLKDEELAVFRRRKIGFIFQNYNLIPSLNVWENIVLPMGLDKKKVDRKFVRDLTERIGIADKLKSLPNTSRELPLPVPWHPNLPSYWQMNPPAIWIPRQSWKSFLF